MLSRELFDGLPDLLLLLRRDGSPIAHAGGRGVVELGAVTSTGGFEPTWSESTAVLVRRLARKAITNRAPVESRFREGEKQYEIRVHPQGPDRAICVIRPSLRDAGGESLLEQTGELRQLQLDHRGFLRRFKESTAEATLCERPVAVAVLYIEEVVDIAQIIATRVSEQIMTTALARLPVPADDSPNWYLGQLGANLLALVVESADRDAIEAVVLDVCARLREPIAVGDAEFRLTPYAGVSILGVDASSPRVLLDHARAAAAEARRAASRNAFFFSDTMQLKSLERIDIARDLREAIATDAIRLRYTGRHDLRTGRLSAWVGYVRWEHPLHGEIRPAKFLRVAQTIGLATSLSRSVLAQLPSDFAALGGKRQPDFRISLGALHDHVLHEDFVADLHDLLADGRLPPEQLEIRIAEKLLVARDPASLRSLQQLGVQFVVDEVGRDFSSLPVLARAPVWGLQLDRAWVQALATDPVARSICKAGISIAAALALTPIATGVDDEAQRNALLELGCHYGIGDLYGGAAASDATPAPAAESA
ncbi:MAG TPA: EAL domain-containing protein [Rhodanobacteraceae bacterium]|nr:EAL domain-containing protein [Rhodanobacteraceae bacterium]